MSVNYIILLIFPSGDSMRVAAKEFADDPCASAKRATMVRAARALLSSVTRLLCVADMADVYRLLASLKLVSTTAVLSAFIMLFAVCVFLFPGI